MVGGKAGAVSVDVDASGHVALTCLASSSGGGGGAAPILRINEFSTGTTGALANEFVEVVNVGPAAADLSGYRLVYRSATGTSDTGLATIPAGTMLAAGGFYLFAGSGYAGSATPNQSFGAGLSSTAGGLALRDAAGAIVDSVGYGTTAANAFVEKSPAAAPPVTAIPGNSAARIPDGHDTDDNSTDFTIATTPTPGATNG
jgi:hypothetical protein